jgi:drug/metabolite transporter (DMT)-like permease
MSLYFLRHARGMHRGVVYALLAAALFGASTPVAKELLGELPPITLAGLLYAGSGLGLALLQLFRTFCGTHAAMAWPSRRQWGWLGAAIFFGGVLGPILLMSGLASIAASTASLLLNLESALTAMLAWFVFRENFDWRIACGMAAIVAGSVVLSIGPGGLGGVSPASLLVSAACLCWAIDNNLTRKVSAGDPILIAGLKGAVAGVVNISVSMAIGHAMPRVETVAVAAGVGFLGYGLSLVLFVLALRHLGAARTGAYFGLAPFVGSAVAVLFFGDTLTLQLCIAAALMALGLWLHISEVHVHEHTHEALEHVHAHRHDEHHQHVHASEWDGTEPHTHRHVHQAMAHKHPHFPDIHHRHRHS